MPKNTALPTTEALSGLVSVLPDFNVEQITVNLPTSRFERLAGTEHAMYTAIDLIEGGIQAAYGQGSVPAVDVLDEDCGERISVSVTLTAPDKDDHDSEGDYEEARTCYAENRRAARCAVALLAKTVVKAVLAADPRAPAPTTGKAAEDASFIAAALGIPKDRSGPTTQQERKLIAIRQAAAVDIVQEFLGSDEVWQPETLYRDQQDEDGTMKTLIRVEARGSLVGSITVTTGREDVTVEVADENGASEIYDCAELSCQRLEALRRHEPLPDADAIATALLEVGFRPAPADQDGNSGFVVGDLSDADAVHVATRRDGYAVGFVNGAWLETTYMGMVLSEAVAAAVRTPGIMRMSRLEGAMHAAGFYRLYEQDGTMGFVSGCPVHAASKCASRTLKVCWAETGYQLRLEGRGKLLEGTYRDLMLQHAVQQAVEFHNRDQATTLARLLLSSLHLDADIFRSSDLFAWRGDISVLTSHEELTITVTSAVKGGVSLALCLRRADVRVEESVSGIRTPADWVDAVAEVQKQVEDMEYMAVSA